MNDTDTDIATLEGLFPNARTDYEALRHDRPLRQSDIAPQHVSSIRRRLIAASVVLALGIAGLISWTAQGPQGAGSVPQMAANPGAFPQAPVSRPQSMGVSRPSLASVRPTFEFSLPQRPGGSNG